MLQSLAGGKILHITKYLSSKKQEAKKKYNVKNLTLFQQRIYEVS